MNNAGEKNSVIISAHQSVYRQYQTIAVLLAAGLLLGVTTNLAKVSFELGIAPLPFLTWSLMGATLILTSVSAYRKRFAVLNLRTLEYFIVAGFLSSAGANLIFFNAVPRVGVSFVAMMMALPPLLTYIGALVLRMERFCWFRAAGVLLALCGTALLVAWRWKAPDMDVLWITLSLAGPVLLAVGNIYRSRRWPPGASADVLAPGMLAAGTSLLLLYAMGSGASLVVAIQKQQHILLIVTQAMLFSGQFFLMFVLQKIGGPVFLSLMGGVSAVFGVPIAVLLLGEPTIPGFFSSAVLVVAGIVSLLLGERVCLRESATSRAGGV